MKGLPYQKAGSGRARGFSRKGGQPSRLLALGLAIGAASSVHAADLGGLKVLSAAGEPLRAEIAVTALTPQEASTLKAAVAPREVYRQTRLEYDEALSNLKLDVEDRPDGRKVVIVSSSTPLNVHVLDLLVELTWNMGRFIRQYTFILDAPPPKAQAPETQASTTGATQVNPGDTLYGIAGRLRPEGASLMQTMAALLRANPQAFVDGNMNRLRAGASLATPGASDIAAIDQGEAEALFAAQAQAFQAYRQRIAGNAGQAPATADRRGAESGGDIAKTPAPPSSPSGAEGDALKLSGGGQGGNEQTARDRLEEERDATAKAVREAESRMQALQGNVEAMRGLLEAQNETLARMEQQARDRAAGEAGQPSTAPAPDASATSPAAVPEAGAQAGAGADAVGQATPSGAAPEAPAQAAVPAGAAEGQPAAAAPAGEDAPPATFAASVARKVRDNSVAVLGAIVAVLAVIFGALALRRRATRAEEEQARETARLETEEAQEEADALPSAEPERVNHLRDWDDIPPFPIPDTPVHTAGEPEDYPDDDEPDEPPPGRPAPPMSAASAAAFGLDLNLDGAPPAGKPAHDGAAAPARDAALPNLDLDADLDAPVDPSAKLDLAKAYADMGDRDGARELLEEVLREGDAGQRERARALLASW